MPPAFPNPLSSPIDMDIVNLVFTQKEWPIEMKDVEE
jgi:hypothetical protein